MITQWMRSVLALAVCTLVLTGCYNPDDYKRIYGYQPLTNGEVPATLRGGYFRNASLTAVGGVNKDMGYAVITKIDGLTAPYQDTPSPAEKILYGAGGFLVGKEIEFPLYQLNPGQHTIITDITMLGRTSTVSFRFYAQPGMPYQIMGEGTGLSVRAWLADGYGRRLLPIVGK